MDKKLIEDAVDDIQIIKKVIDNTSISLAGCSKIFMLWGVIFLFLGPLIYKISSNLNIIQHSNIDFIVSFSFNIILFSACLFVYLYVSKKTQLIGLGKKLMTIWLSIITFDIFISWIIDFLSNFFVATPIDITPVLFLTFAFGTLCINIFTNYKFPIILSIIYLLLTIFFWLFLDVIPLDIYFALPNIPFYSIPGGFLLIGFYLELTRRRRISCEY